jgi:hypothetical protein
VEFLRWVDAAPDRTGLPFSAEVLSAGGGVLSGGGVAPGGAGLGRIWIFKNWVL